MKKILYPALTVCAVILMASCHFGEGFSVFMDGDGDGGGYSTMEINNNGYVVKVKYAGDIEFNDSETAIKSISPGGILKYWKNGRKLTAESNKNGVIFYKIYDDGDNVNPTSERGEKLMALMVKDLINLGFDAKGRVNRIYQKGGTAAVLDEIDYLKNDFVKQQYFEQLLNTKYLNPAEMTAVAKSVGVQLNGDYEKSEVLKKFAGSYVTNAQTSAAYFNAANTIKGDYEKAEVLKAAVNQPLNKAAMGQLLVVANTINGDYEKGEVLKKITETKGLGQENCDKLLDVATSMNGAFEKAAVLTELIDNESLGAESFNRLLFVAGHIGGDYEKSGVLKKIVGQPIATGDEWINLIKATASIGTAYEKSDVLVTIAKKMPADVKIKAAYMEAAKTIGSDYEYAQAVKAAE